MMMRLREATTEDLPGLLERLAKHLPYSFAVHGVVKVQLQYNPDSGMQVLVGPAPSSLVLITPMCPGMETQNLTLFWDVDHDDDGTVAELLGSTPHLDWTKPVHFRGVPIPLLEKVEQMVKSGELGNGRLVAEPLFMNHLYTITASRLSTSPRLPMEFRLGAIEEHHAEHLHKHWEYREIMTLESYRRMLRILPAVGVFTTNTAPTTTTADETLQDKHKKNINVGKTMQDTLACTVNSKEGLGNTLETTVTEDNASGETVSSGGDEAGQSDTSELPVAWTSLSYRNYINNTFTLKEYRRQGLGRAVTLALAARVLHDDDRVSTFIDYDNDTSIKFHEQLGFTRECDFGWQRYTVLSVYGGTVTSGVKLEGTLVMMRLREATTEDLPGLLARLAKYLPYSFAVHGVVKIRLQYNPDTGMQVLVGPAPSFLVVITPMFPGMETQNLTLFWDVDYEDDGAVAELLGSTPHLDWTKPVHFCSVPILLLEKVEQMVRRGELGNGRLVAEPFLKAHLYTITASRLPTTPRLPKEFRVGAIGEHHAEHLHKHWENRATMTLESYRRMLRTFPAVGVFTTTTAQATTTADATLQDKHEKNTNLGKTMQDTLACTVSGKKGLGNTLETTVTEDDASGETVSSGGDEAGQSDTSELPVAWTTLSYRNYINNTFTLKEYRRQGLGRAVTLALAARVLHDDDRVSALIACDNDTSIKFHEQLGFTRECDFGRQKYS